jgi:hypothetical protein
MIFFRKIDTSDHLALYLNKISRIMCAPQSLRLASTRLPSPALEKTCNFFLKRTAGEIQGGSKFNISRQLFISEYPHEVLFLRTVAVG